MMTTYLSIILARTVMFDDAKGNCLTLILNVCEQDVGAQF